MAINPEKIAEAARQALINALRERPEEMLAAASFATDDELLRQEAEYRALLAHQAAAQARKRIEARNTAGRRLEAVERAEASLAELAAALADISACGRELAKELREAGESLPPDLWENASADRASRFIAAALARFGHPQRFGQLEWFAGADPQGPTWAETERQIVNRTFPHLIEEN